MQSAGPRTASWIALSGSGWLTPYHVGVLSGLRRTGLIDRFIKVPVAGTSGGALVAAADACGLSEAEMLKATIELGAWANDQPRIVGKLGPGLLDAARDIMPEDAHERCRGRLAVTVTPARPSAFLPWSKPDLVTSFRDKEDLIQAVYCSSFIPFYLELAPAAWWRGSWWCDGGLVDIIPPVDAEAVRPTEPEEDEEEQGEEEEEEEGGSDDADDDAAGDDGQSNRRSSEPEQRGSTQTHSIGPIRAGVIKSCPFRSLVQLRSDRHDVVVPPSEGAGGDLVLLLRRTFVPGDEAWLHGLRDLGEISAERWYETHGGGWVAAGSGERRRQK